MLVDGGKLPDWQAVIFIPQDVSVFFWIDSTSTQIHLQKLVDGLPDASYSARMTMAVEIGRTKFPDRNNGNSSVVYWDPSTAISGNAIIVGSSVVGKTHRLRYPIRSLITNTRNINNHIHNVNNNEKATRLNSRH